MNFLDPYLNRNANNQVIISAKQACSFAKQVAGDFNPIHDADSKRLIAHSISCRSLSFR